MTRLSDDELDALSELERRLRVGAAIVPGHFSRKCAAAISSLRSQLQAAEQDARRYRWLREHGGGIEVPDDTYPNQTIDLWLGTTALDKEVDDAIARAGSLGLPVNTDHEKRD